MHDGYWTGPGGRGTMRTIRWRRGGGGGKGGGGGRGGGGQRGRVGGGVVSGNVPLRVFRADIAANSPTSHY